MKPRASRQPQAQGSGPMTLEQVVSELVDRFHDPRDWPADHRCSKDGPSQCSHQQWADRALLARAAHLVKPGSGSSAHDADSPRAKGGKPQGGSPAPWAAGPALLVDEAHRGAIDFDHRLRQALDLGPLYVQLGARIRRGAPRCEDFERTRSCPHPSCRPQVVSTITAPVDRSPLDLAGVAALRGLPLLVELLKERDATHDLVAGPLIDPAHPDHGRSWGRVERTVRRWHRDARALTGHVEPPVILRQRANPFAGQPWAGPTCDDAWSCGHLSCRLLFLAPRPPWETAVCPHCGTPGFRWNEETGVMHCDHPRCRDADGRRPSWSMDAFMRPITELTNALEAAR